MRASDCFWWQMATKKEIGMSGRRNMNAAQKLAVNGAPIQAPLILCARRIVERWRSCTAQSASSKELDCRFGESQSKLLDKNNNVMVRMKHVTTIGIEFSYLTVSPQLELNSLTGEVVDHWGTAAGWVVPRDEWCSWKAQKRKQRQSQSSALLSESKSKTLVGLQNTVCCFQTNPLSPCAGVAFSWERAETRYILGGALKAKGEFVKHWCIFDSLCWVKEKSEE